MGKAPALGLYDYSCIMVPCNVAAPLASDRGFLTELIFFLHTFS
jgi:hypothetical protein